MKNKIFKIASLAAVFAFIMGCDNSAIDGVKNGTLKGYEQTTVGKAFESVLGNPQWTYFETNKGVRVVQLSGSPSSQIVPTFLYRRLCVNQSKYNMKIQFTLHTTDDGFDIAYCGLGEDKSMDCGDFIQYAYGGNSSYEPVDCSIFGTLTDARDGHTYGSVKIGNQVWMSENLNYKVDDSWCCHDDERECEKYGRLYLYPWAAAMDACPMGWHLPTQKEFETLIYAVGGSRSAGTKLKSQSGWKKYQSGWMINTTAPMITSSPRWLRATATVMFFSPTWAQMPTSGEPLRSSTATRTACGWATVTSTANSRPTLYRSVASRTNLYRFR